MISRVTSKSIAFTLVTFVALALSIFVPAPSYAQVVGATLSGTLMDSSGAIIPNAQVSIKNTATGVVTTATSDSAGFYILPNLAPGSYDVTATAAGFATLVESNISLAVGEKQSLNITMKVGETNQKVEVTAEVPTVELTSSAISGLVNDTTMKELPLNGRDWTSLANLQTGVLGINVEEPASSPTAPRSNSGFGNQVSVDGHRANDNNYRVNGITVVDWANSAPGSVIGGALGVDAIAEFSVITSNYSAEYGRTTGGVINAITKSGTNTFHGDAYGFLRDSNLDARNFFDPSTIPPFHRNDFGGAVGGPIRKDKAFFFFNYEGLRQDKSSTFSDLVPSPAARAGNLCSIPIATGSGACTPTTITVSPLVTPYLPFWPLPNAGLIGNGDVGVALVPGAAQFKENYYTSRGDFKISEKDSLDAAWFYDNGPFTQPEALGNALYANSVLRTSFSLEESHTFSPQLVNTMRIGYNRDDGGSGTPVKALTAIAAETSLGSLPGKTAASIAVPGVTTMGGGLGAIAPIHYILNSYQAYDDAILTRGTHSLKFGFAFEHMQLWDFETSRPTGEFEFPSLEAFLLDEPTDVQYSQPGTEKPIRSRQSIFAVYLQDDWHVRPNLTLNLGLRYEPTTLPTDAQNNFQNVSNFFTGTSVPVHTLWQGNASLQDVDPRVGLAWDPFGSGKTSVRAGFGIFSNLPINWVYANGAMGSSYPFTINIDQTNLAPGSFPTGVVLNTGFSLADAVDHTVQQYPGRSYDMNWNLNIQHEITPSWTATLGYIGSQSIRLARPFVDRDMVLPIGCAVAVEQTGNCESSPGINGLLWPFPVGSGVRLNPNVGDLRGLDWGGFGRYDALQAQVTKKLSHGLQAQGAYTWSKCLDTGSTSQFGNGLTNSVLTLLWFDHASTYGRCDYNIAHNFVLNYVWVLPTPKFTWAPASYLLGGWETSGVFTAATGEPFQMAIAGDPLGQLNITPAAIPDQLPGCKAINGNFKSQGMDYVNLNCFTPPVVPSSFPNYATSCQPAAASVAAVIPFTCMNLLGNARRNGLTGPGLADLDFALFKNNRIPRISETFNVQFRAEFFNVLNHSNFLLPTDNLQVLNQDGTQVSGAGRIDTTTTDSREIQLALKVIF